MIRHLIKITLIPLLVVFSISTMSQLDSVMDENKDRTKAAAVSQAKIDSTQIKTDKASTEYKSVSKNTDSTQRN